MKPRAKSKDKISNQETPIFSNPEKQDILHSLLETSGGENLNKLLEEISAEPGEKGTVLKMLTEALDTQGAVITEYLLYAVGATAEMEKLKAEAQIRERDEQLSRLVDSAMDAIIQLDQKMKVTVLNPAAQKLFGNIPKKIIGHDFSAYLADESAKKLKGLIAQLTKSPNKKPYLWIPGGLNAKGDDGTNFPAEATLSYFNTEGRVYFTLILRNINERLEAEQKINNLSAQTEYLRAEIKSLKNFDKIIGQSPALIKVLKEMEKVAKTNATVLILGETGTGKELIARSIHDSSPRAEQQFITVNCAAIPPDLIESELFGHEIGAFTGATKRREGRFFLANRGSIFLDEIGELPLDLQVKLLRVLQEGEFSPVGSSKNYRVDVRVIAATNRNLEKEVQSGKFREDLFYRLNVFPINVPPLRKRREDIVFLADAFVKKFSKKMARKPVLLSENAQQSLKKYDWPGNVRELENVIERALITSHQGQLDFSFLLFGPGKNNSKDLESHQKISLAGVLTENEFRDLERENIKRALNQTRWHVSGENGAARLLGIKPTTLRSRIKALGLKPPS